MKKRKKTTKSVTPIVTELSVAYVKFGGNSSSGEYFFAFDKKHIHVPSRGDLPEGCKGIKMIFKLADHVPEDFLITGLVSTDTSKNLSPGIIYCSLGKKCREIEVLNQIETSGFFNIGILVTDTKRFVAGTKVHQVVFCDPQVINTPGEGDNG
jgi:hypothetical protein